MTRPERGGMSTQPARITPMKQVKRPEKAAILGQITPKQEEFLETYLLVHDLGEASEQLEISDRTARRWMTLPAVQQALALLRQERRDAIQNKIERSLDLATELIFRKLHAAVYDKGYADPDRVDKYIAMLLKYVHDQREVDALKVRIEELEAVAASNVVDADEQE